MYQNKHKTKGNWRLCYKNLNLAKHKSPGTEGLPVEFYEAFIEDLCQVFNYALQKNGPPKNWP